MLLGYAKKFPIGSCRHLGVAYYTGGQREAARQALRQAVRPGAAFRGRDRAEALLEQLAE